MPVKKPLMVLATLPRVLGPAEEVSLPVTVFAMDKKVSNVLVSIETNDLVAVSGEKKKQLNFKAEGEEVVNFNLKVKEKTGTGQNKSHSQCRRRKGHL
ncbi:MAG: hypothetical protein HC896_09450 [Bacteroidales bacterium]|nr:hypothetical protein [Bacteroidales bacterium]